MAKYRSATNGTQAIRAVVLPSRAASSTMPPASGRTTRPTIVAPTAAYSGANASSRRTESWLPPMATTGIDASWSLTSVSTRSASASGPGARESYRSPATRTPSTRSSTAIRTTSSRTAANSSVRGRFRIVRPRCQSEVCRSRMVTR